MRSPLVTTQKRSGKGFKHDAIGTATWASQGKFRPVKSRLRHFTPTYLGTAELTVTIHSVLKEHISHIVLIEQPFILMRKDVFVTSGTCNLTESSHFANILVNERGIPANALWECTQTTWFMSTTYLSLSLFISL